MGSLLQGVVLRPYVLKTVISGGLELPLPGGRKHTPRLALGISVAGGFSGGPVFSARVGQVAGMISSQTIEKDELGSWPAGISLAVTPRLIRRELKRHAKRTDRTHQEMSLVRMLLRSGGSGTSSQREGLRMRGWKTRNERIFMNWFQTLTRRKLGN